jgi:hypothetical protein
MGMVQGMGVSGQASANVETTTQAQLQLSRKIDVLTGLLVSASGLGNTASTTARVGVGADAGTGAMDDESDEQSVRLVDAALSALQDMPKSPTPLPPGGSGSGSGRGVSTVSTDDLSLLHHQGLVAKLQDMGTTHQVGRYKGR